jgi:hypothetical protein
MRSNFQIFDKLRSFGLAASTDNGTKLQTPHVDIEGVPAKNCFTAEGPPVEFRLQCGQSQRAIVAPISDGAESKQMSSESDVWRRSISGVLSWLMTLLIEGFAAYGESMQCGFSNDPTTMMSAPTEQLMQHRRKYQSEVSHSTE